MNNGKLKKAYELAKKYANDSSYINERNLVVICKMFGIKVQILEDSVLVENKVFYFG